MCIRDSVKTASDFLLLLMGNSHKPWSVLRIIKSAVVDMNDRKLAVTAYNIIGVRLIALLERKVEHINNLRKSNDFDGHEAALLIEDYNQMSVGFEPVSYTHLDVYKRQYNYRIFGKFCCFVCCGHCFIGNFPFDFGKIF